MNAQQIYSHVEFSIDALASRIKGGHTNTRIKRMTRPGSDSVMTMEIARTLSGVPGFNIETVFPRNGNINPSKPQRLLQFLNVLVHNTDCTNIDPVTLRTVVALREAPAMTLGTHALQLIALGGRADPRANRQGIDAPDTKGISIARIDALAPFTVGVGSTSSMTSRSFGSARVGYEGDGFCVSLGMVTTVGHVDRAVTLQPSNPFTQLFFARVDRLTDAQILRIVKGKKGE